MYELPPVDAETDDLFTIADVQPWVQGRTIAEDDALAHAVIAAVSLKLRAVTGEWTWTASAGVNQVPGLAKMTGVQLAKRTYLNPNAVVAEGGIGPIGGDRYIEDFARTLEFTEAELVDLAVACGHVLPGDPDGSGGNGLWVQPITVGPAGLRDAYRRDSGGSDWEIPVLDSSQTWLWPTP